MNNLRDWWPLCLVLACVPATTLAPPDALNGIWASDGYGYVLAIDGDLVRFFHVTPEICVESDEEVLRLDDVFDRQRLRADGVLLLSTSSEPYEFVFRRRPSLPGACRDRMGSGLRETVEAFESYVRTHYAFFAERGIARDDALRDFRQEAARAKGEAELFDAMTAFLTQTRDAHVELRADIDGAEQRFDADPGLIRRRAEVLAGQAGRSSRDERLLFREEFWTRGVGEGLLGGTGGHAGNDRIRWGMVAPGVGYLGLRSMGGFLPAAGAVEATEEDVLDTALDHAIARFDRERARAVVLDLSINSGGYDHIARRLASRLSAFSGFAYSRFPRDTDKPVAFGVEVQPGGTSQFIGPLYVLTSQETVSAAELAVVILRADPQTVHVGATTRGALSTKLAKLLPNGWTLTLSNEVYLDHAGMAWEARGIPPHREIPVFPRADLSDQELGAVDLSVPHRQAVDRIVDMIRRDIGGLASSEDP